MKTIKTEEKGSNVNITVQLLNDAWLNKFDYTLVVSKDSDLSEAMKFVQRHHPDKKLGLFMPGKVHPSKELMQCADFVKHIREGVLDSSQLQDQILKANIYKPQNW